MIPILIITTGFLSISLVLSIFLASRIISKLNKELDKNMEQLKAKDDELQQILATANRLVYEANRKYVQIEQMRKWLEEASFKAGSGAKLDFKKGFSCGADEALKQCLVKLNEITGVKQ